MVRKVAIDIPAEAVADFCRRWKATELALFGSVLRSDFRPDSDVDVLATFAPDAAWTLFDVAEMEDDLRGIFGRSVDLVSRRAIEDSHNWIRREAILRNSESIYVAR